jgi:transcription antitermination factor NusG
LDQKKYRTFLPTWLECRQYSDRIKRIESALFPGYLFCRLDPEYRLPILTTPGVYSIVGFDRQPAPVDPDELAAIERLALSGASIVPWPFLKIGQKVAVQVGAFAGLEGILVSTKSVDRLVLSVTLLQRSLGVEIERSWIRPV